MRKTMLKRSIPALILAGVLGAATFTADAAVSIGISVNLAPPPLPVYVQPAVPAPGYIWTPGYWAWDSGDYYWVPGTWVEPPEAGLLWTPGYWGWANDAYLWHAGYWGPQVGFYGGVNYGYGYTGHGFEGGYWRDRTFFYNRSVANVRTTNITNVYNKTVINNVTINRVSYNGGSGGISARASAADERAANERHVAFTRTQEDHQRAASQNRELRDSVNHGRPSVAATEHAGNFSGRGVFAARAAGGAHPAEAHTRDNVRDSGHDNTRPNGERAPGSARPEGIRAPAGEAARVDTHQPHMTRPQPAGVAAPRPASPAHDNAARENAARDNRPHDVQAHEMPRQTPHAMAGAQPHEQPRPQPQAHAQPREQAREARPQGGGGSRPNGERGEDRH